MRLFIILSALFFIGCTATGKVYEGGKQVYGSGKVIYKVLPAKSNTLETADVVLIEVDKTRTLIRK